MLYFMAIRIKTIFVILLVELACVVNFYMDTKISKQVFFLYQQVQNVKKIVISVN